MAKNNRNRRNHGPQVYLNLNVRGMGLSATMGINERCGEMRANGRQVFRLGLGQSPFPVPASVVEELRANAWRKDYLPVRGLRELREAVSHYHRRINLVHRAADDVLIGPGSKELMFLLQLVYYGDLVIPTPAWVSYAPQAQIVGRNVRFLHTLARTHWRLMPEQLEGLCKDDPDRPRILVLNYPSNPTGGTYGPDELEELAEVARRYHVVLLSDEIYGELHHKGEHVSVARFYPEGTIISGGLSKWCGAGGWRLGTFTFPKSLRWLLETMAYVASETYTSTCAPIQYAAVRAFRGGTQIENYLTHARRILSALGQELWHRLKEAGVRVQAPEGAFYLFADFRPFARVLRREGIRTSEHLCEKLLEDTGVAVLPGSAFMRAQEEFTARIAYVNFDGARALLASEAIPLEKPLEGQFLQTHCADMLTAVDRIVEWLEKYRP